MRIEARDNVEGRAGRMSHVLEGIVAAWRQANGLTYGVGTAIGVVAAIAVNQSMISYCPPRASGVARTHGTHLQGSI